MFPFLDRKEDDFGFIRGLFNTIVISVAAWIIIIGVGYGVAKIW
jgi:hypothetical protein|tara:strand:+ start:1667 stop:1798 length:132 start_codon:yes stop_codon:yes gene_type:complete